MTHFLSFSSDRVVAESFARGRTGGQLVALPDDEEHWNTSLFTFDTQRLHTVQPVSPGVFAALFSHQPQAFATALAFEEALGLSIQDQNYRGHDIPVVLIDSMAALEAVEPKTSAVNDAIEKAKWDREWLVLPADPFSDSLSGRVELTALLDASCISRKEKFRSEAPAP
jgi:hypothetical protein